MNDPGEGLGHEAGAADEGAVDVGLGEQLSGVDGVDRAREAERGAEGFHQLIPQELVTVFDERELELLMGGISEIDCDDWKKHTDYRGYTEQDEVVQWFWKCIRSWDSEKKARLLQFTTGDFD